ncbi:MAG TPA: TetR/AcrR family transcriptional regulator [Rhodanobacteraceae bacterium]|nr:TetR/AcrR family transcriptional regulator [Rhodanobacteraceae bacterium]
MRDNPQFSTRQRILGAAEELFAERGFAAASLRQVTAAAKVNLAAVNYHFGSKNNLIEEVFRRRLDELSQRRLERLADVAQSESTTLETLLDAFITPALELSLDREGGSVFMRVLARAFAEHNSNLRRFLSKNYGYVLKDFAVAFARLLPQLDKEELYWRLDIAVGALTYAMADFGMIQRRSGESERAHRENMAKHLIHFTAAGLRA